jgi:hypothetical protein
VRVLYQTGQKTQEDQQKIAVAALSHRSFGGDFPSPIPTASCAVSDLVSAFCPV